jgi:hypothetical protein
MQTNVEGLIAKQTASSARINGELDLARAELKFEKLFRKPMTIASHGNVRIDVQGPWTPGKGRTIQAQLGKTGTIAAVRLADSLENTKGAVNQDAVVAAVGAALVASLDGHWRSVTGTMP